MEHADPEAVVAGHICLDISPDFGPERRNLQELLLPGRVVRMKGAVISAGGSVANTGLALVKSGVKTLLIGKIGTDYFGEIVQRILDEQGANHRMLTCSDSGTAYTVILTPPETDRIFLHNSGANDTFSTADLEFEQIQKARLFHFGYPNAMARMYRNGGSELEQLMRTVRGYQLTTSLDLSLPDPESEAGQADWKGILQRVLPHVDIFAPSAEEILFMMDPDSHRKLSSSASGGDPIDALDPEALSPLAERLLQWGAAIVLIKCGKRGLYLRTGSLERITAGGRAMPGDLSGWVEREVFEESFRAPAVVSTSGAGDTSIAGFLASVLRGYPMEKAIRIAAATGALCVQSRDAVSRLLPLDQTWRIIEAGWEKVPLQPAPDSWRYKPEEKLWEVHRGTAKENSAQA